MSPLRSHPALLRALVAALALSLAAPAPLWAQKGREPVTLNFVNADIEGVARAMGAILDRQIVVDPRVKGNITLYSEQPMPPSQAFLSFQTALRGLGFAVVEVEGILKVVPEADAKLQTGTVSVGAVNRKGDQIITQIFRLQHENANNLVAVLRPLISPNNTINVNPGNNSLVITDYADNLQRIAKIIAATDIPSATDLEVIPLKHAIASDMATLVQRLSDGGGAGAQAVQGAAGGTLTVMADARSNSLLVRAPNAARLAMIKSVVEKLDQPGQNGAGGSNIFVVYLKNADATRLAQVLRAAYSATGSGGGAAGGASTLGGAQSANYPATGVAAAGATSAIGGTTGTGGTASVQATAPVQAAAQPSTGGFIQADPATNSLIITAPEPVYRQLRAVIDQLDSRRAQVYIESLIVEMTVEKAAEFGFQWQGLLGKKGDKTGVFGGTNFGTGGSNIVNLSLAAAGINTSGSSSSSTSITLPTGLNVGLIRNYGGVYTLGALANFLNSQSDTNVLSTPNLIALDNEEAKITIGQNVPFVTGQYTSSGTGGNLNPFQTIERKDVGVTLRVKPAIGENGTIRMTIYQENSSVVASTSSNTNGPTTNKSSVETSVTLDDGQIMVLGGMMQDSVTTGVDKVPGLGDIPLVGNLFRNESRKHTKTTQLVFLRPVVLRDADASSNITLDRYEAIRAEQAKQQPPHSVIMPINEVPVLPPLPAKPGATPAAPAPQPAASAPAN